MVHTPVLLITYNRLDNTRRVLDVLRRNRVSVLYVAGDGAKSNPVDEEKVRHTREQIRASIDWDCTAYYRFSQENQGCKYGPINAINWIFENEERAIILEDDIVPGDSFFPFCEELLDDYADDDLVSMISGCNIMNVIPGCRTSYFFGPCPNTWGWATWRRAWRLYDVSMPGWLEMKKSRQLYRIFARDTAFSLTRDFDASYRDEVDGWDYQWQYTQVRNHMHGITPCKSLVENIGLGDVNATHTAEKLFDFKANTLEFPLVHPKKYEGNREYENYCEKFNYVNYWHLFLKKLLPTSLVKKIQEYRKKHRKR